MIVTVALFIAAAVTLVVVIAGAQWSETQAAMDQIARHRPPNPQDTPCEHQWEPHGLVMMCPNCGHRILHDILDEAS